MYAIVSDSTVDGFKVRKATWEGFSLDLIMSPNAPANAEFLPAKIEKDGVECWSFKKDHPYYRGLATLVEYNDELVIVLATRFNLDMVLPVRDLPNMQKIAGEFVGGRKLKAFVSMKGEIAEELGLTPVWSKREANMLRALDQAAAEANAEVTRAVHAARIAARAEEERRRERERAEREARRARIASRKKIVAFTATGDRRIGVPVVGNEWMVLRDGSFCISVTSYKEKTGAVGDYLESFEVLKRGGGNPSRKSVAAVTHEYVKSVGSANVITELETTIIVINGEPEEVIMTDDVQKMKTLCSQGLNSGTYVMSPKANDPARFVVYRLEGGRYESVTEVMRKHG